MAVWLQLLSHTDWLLLEYPLYGQVQRADGYSSVVRNLWWVSEDKTSVLIKLCFTLQ